MAYISDHGLHRAFARLTIEYDADGRLPARVRKILELHWPSPHEGRPEGYAGREAAAVLADEPAKVRRLEATYLV